MYDCKNVEMYQGVKTNRKLARKLETTVWWRTRGGRKHRNYFMCQPVVV